jgi:hypothetical protein
VRCKENREKPLGGSGKKKSKKRLTAINLLGCLLLDGAGIVLVGGLGSEAGSRAILVQVAVLVHGLLQGVTLPAEDVVTVSGSATVFEEKELESAFPVINRTR